MMKQIAAAAVPAQLLGVLILLTGVPPVAADDMKACPPAAEGMAR